MTIEQIRRKEKEIFAKYKDSDDTAGYYNEIEALYAKLDEEPEKEEAISIQDLLGNLPVNKLEKKSGVSLDIIKENFFENVNLTLLDACKLSLGFKRLGIYADETMLLGDDAYDKLYMEFLQRSQKGTYTKDDEEYLKLQQSFVRGINITYLRQLQGMTRKELAEKTKMSKRSLEKYEMGENNIQTASANTVYNIADALKCRMEDIMGKERLSDEYRNF